MSKYDHKRKYGKGGKPLSSFEQVDRDPHIIDSHSGGKVFYKGRGKKSDTDLKQFDSKRDKYWDNLADEWIKKNSSE